MHDIRQMFANCLVYNYDPQTHVEFRDIAIHMMKKFEDKVSHLFPPQLQP
jgi:hypothetical protein